MAYKLEERLMYELTKGQKTVSVILKIIIILSAIIGTTLSAMSSAASFMGGETVFMYFTIQSNILIALVCLIGCIIILMNRPCSNVLYVIKLVATVSITLTGMVFSILLAPSMENAWTLSSILLHALVPLLSVIDFFVICNVMKVRKINALWVTVPPLLYAIYAGVGYIRNWDFSQGRNYPYFFLNWGSEAGAAGFSSNPPFLGPVWWILILLAFLIIVGFVYLLIADLIRKKTCPS